MKKICFVLTFFVVSLSLLTTPLYAEVTYSLNTTTKTLTFTYSGSGSSEISDYDNYVSGSAGQRPSTWTFNVETVVINEGVTTIGTNVFDGCTSLKYIYIPKSLTLCKNRAFNGCTVLEKIYYAGTPNDWANIDFAVASSYCYSHPFCARTSGTRSFYFYGQTAKETKNIIFTAPLTTIKQYAFYKANNIENIHIPGTVTTIETHALDCSVKRVYINKSVAPTTGDKAITWISGTDTYLYLRSDATNSFNTTPWYYPTSKSTTGAYWLGYSSDHSSIRENCSWKSARYVVVTSGTQGNINWSLSEDGTLTLSGNGALPKDYNTTYSSSDVLPWFRYRYLVNKVVIEPSGGNITNLTNALDKSAWEIEEINIEQTDLPTATFSFIAGSADEDYRYTTDKVNLLVKANATAIENAKANATWGASNIRLGLNENVVLDEASNNEALLNAINAHIGLPFTAELDRSLKSVSFNSFCSPVPMTAEQVQSVFGAGTEIYTLESSNYNESENTLYINLSDNQTTIEAGKPYIIKPANNEPEITINNINPEDIATAGQTISTDAIDFHGLLNPYTLVSGDKFLVVSADNELNWTTSGTMKGMRSYFTLKSGIPARALSARASFVFPNNSPEAVNNVSNAQQPIQKVMRNGQLVIIRDGVTYNTMGQVIE